MRDVAVLNYVLMLYETCRQLNLSTAFAIIQSLFTVQILDVKAVSDNTYMENKCEALLTPFDISLFSGASSFVNIRSLADVVFEN